MRALLHILTELQANYTEEDRQEAEDVLNIYYHRALIREEVYQLTRTHLEFLDLRERQRLARKAK